MLADDTFAQRYELESEAGRGGMGLVHRAIERGSGRALAIKVLRTPGVESRFTLEAEMLERLEHPAIVAYVGHGVTGSGDAYLAMAWLEGTSLAARLDDGPLSIADTLAVGVRLASALVHAHGHEIVHRDLKPSNVMLVDGVAAQATLIDFGIAKDTAVTHGLTETGQLIGTPGYMAPEQAMGDVAPTASMDLFGLGVVLYECLAGRPPFEGRQTMEVLAQLLLRDPPPLRDARSEVPARLDALVASLLEKEPAHRISDAARVEAELREIALAYTREDRAALAEVPAWMQRAETRATVAARPSRRKLAPSRRKAWIAGGAVALALGGTVAVVVALRGGDEGAVAVESSSVRIAHACEQQGGDACKRACAADDAVACRLVGREAYVGSPSDDAKQHAAIEILGKACRLGDAPACSLAGTWTRRHASHGDVHYERDAWIALFDRGCVLGDATACALLAEHLLAETPPGKDRALTLYLRGCELGNLAACVHAADMLEHRAQPGDHDRATSMLVDACRRGYKRACRAPAP